MGPKYFLLGACCLLAVALASQRQVVVFARDVPMHYSTGHVPLTSNDNAGRGKQPSLLDRRRASEYLLSLSLDPPACGLIVTFVSNYKMF